MKNKAKNDGISIKTRGMKWYKFLIYFWLYAEVIWAIFCAIMYCTGWIHGESRQATYGETPFLQAVDTFYGLAFIYFAFATWGTRKALSWNYRKGPRLFCTLYIQKAVAATLHTLLPLIGMFVFDYNNFWVGLLITLGLIIASPFITISFYFNIIVAIVHYFYFKKRRNKFTY